MLFKCKICGGELNFSQGDSVAECEYCGVRQTLPKLNNTDTQAIYNRANAYLIQNEFDKAENLYNQILLADQEDPEAYWGLLLCKYGVTYVKDPKTHKYIPTCNRTYFSSILHDENYKKALAYADDKQKALYMQDAGTIDQIQKGILAISKKEKPFDIFISYKDSSLSGTRTQDSVKAQELYEKLSDEGYKVFFSRITLESKIGTEYEPYIYAALASSKVMLVIGSSKENLEAVWVKNEWSRYLSFAQRDSSKTVIPLYFDMDKAELPEELAQLTAYDMTSEGFEQELIRGIKKLIPLPVMALERRKKVRKRLKIAGVVMAVLIAVGAVVSVPWFAKLPEYNAAMQLFYDKNYPEAAWAFADLENYRDSEAMKDKAERSWRNSVATIATDNALSGSSSGAYYISPNGTVETFSYSPGNLNEGLEINEHGKFVSISAGRPPYVLYEDGYIKHDNPAFEWHDIIKISDRFDLTPVALRANGTMVFGDTTDSDYVLLDDSWLEEISSWTDIIDFDYYGVKDGSGKTFMAAIVGIKSDGTLCAVRAAQSEKQNVPSELSQFYDVKSIAILYDTIVALTNHDTIMLYADGMFSEYPAEDTVDIIVDNYSGIHELKSDGKLFAKDSGTYLLDDVTHIESSIEDNFVVTRSGGIYRGLHYENTLTMTESKTRIYDEWLERMR